MFQDGRDHEGCCIKERVPDICRDLCRGEYTTVTDNVKTHFSCPSHIERTLSCIADGVGKTDFAICYASSLTMKCYLMLLYYYSNTVDLYLHKILVFDKSLSFLELLPSQPLNVDTVAISPNAINVTWSVPSRNGDTVTEYSN